MKNILKTLIILTITTGCAQNSEELNIGDIAPDFNGTDSEGTRWASKDVSTDFLVVYFYPAAMTGGCTKQACAYRDDKASFDKMGVTVIGVSGDEIEGLKHFKESYQLNFPLLSDSEGKIAKKFGVPVSDGGTFEAGNFLLTRGVTTQRWTFVLDKNKKVIYKNSNVNAEEDSKQVKDIIEKYKS